MPTQAADDRDPLTGLVRTGGFQAHVDAHSRTQEARPFIVGLVDIEGLRHINRDLGNAAGDSLLCQVADRLTSCALADVVARIGGDEFALLADGIDPEVGGQWSRRVRLEALSDPFTLAGTSVRVSFRVTRRAGPPMPDRDLLWEVQRDATLDGTRELAQRAAAYDHALQQVDALHGENERLRHLAMTDPLTGLLNRRGIYEQLTKLGHPLALAFVDLDDLRELNQLDDLWEDGDAAICALAERLRDTFGAESVGRWGGDEFLIIATTTSPEVTADLLRRVLEQCRSEVVIAGRALTFSAGVSSYSEPSHMARATAERAVHEAKITKATVVLY